MSLDKITEGNRIGWCQGIQDPEKSPEGCQHKVKLKLNDVIRNGREIKRQVIQFIADIEICHII